MPNILKIDPERPDMSRIEEAVHILKAGGVIAYPTETFYGLGVNGDNEKAVKKIFLIKGRSFNIPISLLIGNARDVTSLTQEIPETGWRLMERFWPGPLTIVFTASPQVLPCLTGYTGKIGMRVSSHPLAALLTQTLSHPITATSANLSGESESVSATDVIRCFGDRLDLIVDGGMTSGVAGSTIIDLTISPPTVIREGIISLPIIQDVLGGEVILSSGFSR